MKDSLIGKFVIIVLPHYKHKKGRPYHIFLPGDICKVISKNARYVYHLKEIKMKGFGDWYSNYLRDVHKDEFRVLTEAEFTAYMI